MKARMIKVQAFGAATPTDLAAAMNEWLSQQKERELVEVQYQASMDAANPHAALILYTE